MTNDVLASSWDYDRSADGVSLGLMWVVCEL